MAREENNDDQTRVHAPGKTAKIAKKILPDKFHASIVIIEGHAEGMEYPIEKVSTVLGRDKNADIMIKDPSISRQHAAIIYHDSMFILKDLGSTNGTYMKSKKIEKARIRHRDKFQIGDTVIQFILEETTGGRVYEIQDEDD